MKIIYWFVAPILAASIWIASLIFLNGVFIDPVYDQRIELLAKQVTDPTSGKGMFLKIEAERNSAQKRLGALGGVLFGFVFGAFTVIAQKHLLQKVAASNQNAKS
jgi:hypothetical protein